MKGRFHGSVQATRRCVCDTLVFHSAEKCAKKLQERRGRGWPLFTRNGRAVEPVCHASDVNFTDLLPILVSSRCKFGLKEEDRRKDRGTGPSRDRQSVLRAPFHDHCKIQDFASSSSSLLALQWHPYCFGIPREKKRRLYFEDTNYVFFINFRFPDSTYTPAVIALDSLWVTCSCFYIAYEHTFVTRWSTHTGSSNKRRTELVVS